MGNRAIVDFYHHESGLKKPHYHMSLYFQWFDLSEMIDCLESAVNRRYRFDQVSIGFFAKYLAGIESERKEYNTEINTVFPYGKACKTDDLFSLDKGNYRIISDYQKITIEHRDSLNRRWKKVHVITRNWKEVITSIPIK